MKKALLVGINKYEKPGNDLYGCINDVTNIRDILLNYAGFTVSDIRVIVDDRATKAQIIDRLVWLVTDVKPGDNLVFHFSGHGSQIRDRDGDELKDSLDEILCPHDIDWDKNFITDDDLSRLFADLPQGVILDVILDCCHSGTGTRNSTPAIKPRYMRPPVDILCRQEEGLRKKSLWSWILKLLGYTEGTTEKPVENMTHALLAGCRANQYAADAVINNIPNGAFTYYLCKHIRDAQGTITRQDLKSRVKDSLLYNGYDQIPQLEAPSAMWEGVIFNGYVSKGNIST